MTLLFLIAFGISNGSADETFMKCTYPNSDSVEFKYEPQNDKLRAFLSLEQFNNYSIVKAAKVAASLNIFASKPPEKAGDPHKVDFQAEDRGGNCVLNYALPNDPDLTDLKLSLSLANLTETESPPYKVKGYVTGAAYGWRIENPKESTGINYRDITCQVPKEALFRCPQSTRQYQQFKPQFAEPAATQNPAASS